MTETVPDLPERVTIYEVGPRDGLQNESGLVPTQAKAEFVQRLLAAGLPVVAGDAELMRGTPVCGGEDGTRRPTAQGGVGRLEGVRVRGGWRP